MADNVLSLTVEDPRGRLRAGQGDEIRLASEEWFTTEIDPNGVGLYRPGRGGVLPKDLPMVPLRETPHDPGRDHHGAGIPPGGRRPGSGTRPPQARSAPATTPPRGCPAARDCGCMGWRRPIAHAGARYVLISMYWGGRVAGVEHSSHLDTYAVEFTIPQGNRTPRCQATGDHERLAGTVSSGYLEASPEC